MIYKITSAKILSTFFVGIFKKSFTRYYSNNYICKLIRENTEITRHHLSPEVRLRLITPNCKLWYTAEDHCPFQDPFWAFYWPGGQVLARFLLENRHYVEKKSVLDIGSGCGALAIISKMLGATRVVANDIDPVVITAIEMNSSLNDIVLETEVKNLIGEKISNWDVILFGDMLYDTSMLHEIQNWLSSLPQKTTILIGDPGRTDSTKLEKLNFKIIAEYELSDHCKLENPGYMTGSVWHKPGYLTFSV